MAIAVSDPFKTLRDLTPRGVARIVGKHHSVVLPIFSLCMIMVMLVPLPPSIMDVLLAGNITFSAVVLLTVMYMKGALDFTAFPSLLLAATLFRLVLNVATTRLILTNAKEGPSAAGEVVRVFGEFVAGDVLMVGVIIFAIIVIIQFVVITKGATRIAEVAARFTLDGMPGKQMAIDADLNAGLIDEAEARRRREQISMEADFYGAMDGASKFVRGDAVAGLIITFVNILGGVYVGMVNEKMPLMETLEVFTKLTIGDGLVSQIPAFIVSIAAALIVTRSASKKNLGEEMVAQLVQQPVAMILTGAFLVALLATPLPKLPLLGFAAALVTMGTMFTKTRQTAAKAAVAKSKAKPADAPEKLILPDAMEMEVGYGLIKLVDRQQGGDLLDRISNMRRQIAQELGIVVPPVRIRDNMQLQPNQYAIKIRGNQVASGEVLPGHLLAIDSGMVTERVSGTETKEPAFGLPAVWIAPDRRHAAEQRNYTVVEASSVVSTHLTETIKRHAPELLSRQEVNRLIDTLRERAPKLVEELIPNVIKPGDVQKVLHFLLNERVPIRDLETIIETIGDWSPRTKDPDILVEYVRAALARTICGQHTNDKGVLACITLDPGLEESVTAHLEVSDRGIQWTMPPIMQSRIVEAVRNEVERALPTLKGRTPVVVSAPRVRLWMRRMIEPVLPHIAVLSFGEIVRGVEIETCGMVVLKHEA
ncbi:MAG: flagellar biosynthesis protein FlhA [Phycisphaerales bacterium]|nr:flagellar biosynthesis protein FlhA [Phycisphaerales bacterium]